MTKQQQRRERRALKPGQSILPQSPQPPTPPLAPEGLPRKVPIDPPLTSHPAHQLRPEQWVLLELSKAAMYTADEAYPSARDALHQMDHLQALTRDIMGFKL